MSTFRIICVVNDTALPDSSLKSEHGLSMWIETPQGAAMLDSGGSTEVLQHNLRTLRLDPARITALALSHAHDDHTGGLGSLLPVGSELPVFAHPDIFRERFSLKNGEYRSMGLPRRSQMLKDHPQLHLSKKSVELLPNLWASGEITARPELEGRSANHFIKTNEGWEADPYRDDMSLVLETPSGIVLICGCCHAGLLNTLQQVQRQFKQPVRAVLGGTHLISADGSALRHVIEALDRDFPHTNYYLNHCSGADAIRQLRAAFGERVKEFPAGCIFEFGD
jgi:7,8-dihydropterin-6-yl-methyl-4-(beta-D-ribofuranosyl)aminobenzene 5'-phosphate synthase